MLKLHSFLPSIISGLIITACFSCDPSSSNWPPEAPVGARLKIDCSNNKHYSVDVSWQRILVVCRSQADIERLGRLNSEVYEPDLKSSLDKSYRAVRSDVFIAFDVGPYTRCSPLIFVPEGRLERPVNSPMPGKFDYSPGMFHSPCLEGSFDMAGRQFKPGRFASMGVQHFIGNLAVPKYRYVSDTEIEFE